MTLPTASEITSLYLYGQQQMPTSLDEVSLIRATSVVSPTSVLASEYMSDGPGRFANPAFFRIIDAFYNAPVIPTGRYTEQSLRTIVGISEAFITLQQWAYSDSKDDYAERVYIWNTTAFEIDDRAMFIVEPNGDRYIENFAVIPFANKNVENFDFVSSDWIARLGNPSLENSIDLSRIGRTVEIGFGQNIDPTQNTNFTIADYQQAFANRIEPNPINLLDLNSAMQSVVETLWNNGTTQFLDADERPILYASPKLDDVLGSDMVTHSFLARNPYFADYLANGIRFVGSDDNDKLLIDGFTVNGDNILHGHGGNDNIIGGIKIDEIFGGEGNDTLRGGFGDDKINGGAGNDQLSGNGDDDTLDGGLGDDTADGGAGDDKYIYNLSSDNPSPVSSTTRLQLNLASNNDNAAIVKASDLGTGTDFGTDTLTNIETLSGSEFVDYLKVGANGVNADITIDLGESNREENFLNNVDTVDYSAVSQGILYYEGTTATRKGGGFFPGSTVHLDSSQDMALITGALKNAHKLKVENVEKVILTDGDDTFISAARGSIVDLQGGKDKVWLRGGIQVENFTDDDRLTLYGVLSLYGGSRAASSESPWAEGLYGTRYAINPAGDLVVNNPLMKTPDGREQKLIKGENPSMGLNDNFEAGLLKREAA